MQRSRFLIALPLCGAIFSSHWINSAFAQTPAVGAQAFRGALEAAWSRQPAARIAAAKSDEFSVRRRAAETLSPDAPSLTVAHRTDALVGRNRGQREFEAEVALPLWQRGARAATRQTIAQDESVLHAQVAQAKWKLAGEVREAVWNQRFAVSDVVLATRREAEAATLAATVEKRVKAGDLALVDLNQTLIARAQAQAALGEANARLERANATLRPWGIREVAAGIESPASTTGQIAPTHVALLALQRQIDSARGRMELARATARVPLELALGISRERGMTGDPYNTSARVSLKIPFGGETRTAPRVAQAVSELAETEALLEQEHQRLAAELQATRAELAQAQTNITIATERARLAAQSQALFDKAFQLGEIEIATRLRAENERFDADLALSRATLEAGRATSRLNQILGLLP